MDLLMWLTDAQREESRRSPVPVYQARTVAERGSSADTPLDRPAAYIIAYRVKNNIAVEAYYSWPGAGNVYEVADIQYGKLYRLSD